MTRPIDVYLLAGQSNMSGYGLPADVPEDLAGPHPSVKIFFAPLDEPRPDAERHARDHVGRWTPLTLNSGQIEGGFGLELSFGYAMAAATPARPVAIIKSDKGGTGLLRDWRPDDRQDPTALANRMLAAAEDALRQLREQGLAPRLAGFVWYQGESDMDPEVREPARYTAAFDTLRQRIADLLNDGEDFRKVWFRVHPHEITRPHYESIRHQLVEQAEADASAAWIEVDDLVYPDALHLDGASAVVAGRRAAEAMLNLPRPA